LAVEETLKKFDIDFNKCSSTTTNGAKAMTDLKKGFTSQLKQRNLNILIKGFTVFGTHVVYGF